MMRRLASMQERKERSAETTSQPRICRSRQAGADLSGGEQ